MRFGPSPPLLQYFCSECGLLLKQTETELKHTQLGRRAAGQGEECPKCGSLLSYTLQQRRRREGHRSLVIEREEDLNDIQSQSSSFIPRFQTAYEEYNNNISSIQFGFDIHKIDSALNLNSGESLCIIGEQKYTQLLVARLCVNALMMQSRRRKRKGVRERMSCTEKHIIFIDAGNDLDIYQYVNFARQYGLDIKKFLQSIVVSRMFTIYQLANTIIYDLPKLIIQYLQEQQQPNFEPKVIVISDLLDMFVNDPHVKVEEAKNLLKEIMVSILRARRRTREILGNSLIVLSLSCNQRQRQQQSLHLYNKILLPKFDKRIEIIDGSSGSRSCNRSFKVKTTITKNKNDHRVARESKLFSVTEKDLLIPMPF
jgi:hypothetical protein